MQSLQMTESTLLYRTHLLRLVVMKNSPLLKAGSEPSKDCYTRSDATNHWINVEARYCRTCNRTGTSFWLGRIENFPLISIHTAALETQSKSVPAEAKVVYSQPPAQTTVSTKNKKRDRQTDRAILQIICRTKALSERIRGCCCCHRRRWDGGKRGIETDGFVESCRPRSEATPIRTSTAGAGGSSEENMRSRNLQIINFQRTVLRRGSLHSCMLLCSVDGLYCVDHLQFSLTDG
jgi:hypothetical protein